MSDTLAVIPARRGSQTLKRKNILPIGRVPAVLRSAQAARDAGCEVVVSTDDPQVVAVCDGFRVHWRINDQDHPVDHVVAAAADGWDGPVLLVQPTVQPITANILTRFLTKAEASRNTPVAMGVEERHQLFMLRHGWLTERVNRQHMQAPPLRELGVRWFHHSDVIGAAPTLILAQDGLVDIDTIDDYRAAQPSSTIVFAPLADQRHGRGHLHRCLTLAEHTQHHRIVFDTTRCDPDASALIEQAGWDHGTNPPPAALTIIDQLDTTIEQIKATRGKVISLEDLGPGSRITDATINALYGTGTYSGADWCVLRPEFLHGDYTVRDDGDRVLVMCGGTDPAGLRVRLGSLFPEATVVQPGADIPVASTMRHHDVLVTTAGRTVFEAAAVGIPTIVIAANMREATHTHLNRGNVYLGPYASVTDDQIVTTVQRILTNPLLRTDLSGSYRPDGLGVARVVNLIDRLLLDTPSTTGVYS